MDKITAEERSRVMSKIRSKDTKPEVYMRSLLQKSGLRFRKNYAELPGTPDIWFSKQRVAVFIHGCYWHLHEGCKSARVPKSNVEFWTQKFERNRTRDAKVEDELRDMGIRPLVIWECTVKRMMRDEDFAAQMVNEIVEYVYGYKPTT